jgi:hypothetical protein
MELKGKEASCFQHENLLKLKALYGFNKGTFTLNYKLHNKERQPFTCLRCGRIRQHVGERITIYCVEGRTVVASVCVACAKKGAGR